MKFFIVGLFLANGFTARADQATLGDLKNYNCVIAVYGERQVRETRVFATDAKSAIPIAALATEVVRATGLSLVENISCTELTR